MQSSEAGFYFLYLCEMDGFLHMNCRDEKRVVAKLEWYASEVRNLYALARTLDPDVTLSIFSDHGMTPISREYDLMSEIEKLGCRMPKDYLAVYDSTMARFWFFSEDARRSVAEALSQSPCGRILPESELRSLGIWF